MTEVDALKYVLEEERKAFKKLHKRHMDLLKQQGELEKENEQLLKEKIDAETKLYIANDELLMREDNDSLTEKNQRQEFEIINLKKENEKLKQEKREIIQTILDFCNNDYNGHKESFEDLLEEIGWEEGSWLDKDGNIRDFDEVEWND